MIAHFEVYRVIKTEQVDYDDIFVQMGMFRTFKSAKDKCAKLMETIKNNIGYQINYYENGSLISEIEV